MTAQVLEFLGGNPGRTALFEAVEQMDIVAESVLEAEWERQYGDRVKHEWV